MGILNPNNTVKQDLMGKGKEERERKNNMKN